MKTGRNAWNTARGSGDFVALHLRCSAFAKVSFISFVSARVKWLPPIGTLRIQIFWPLETNSVVLSAPMSSRIVYASIATTSSPEADAELVEAQEVVQRQRRDLDQLDFDAPRW